MKPDVSYARNGAVSIAYTVVGDGPVDLVFVPGYVNNLELMWDNPRFAGFLRRLASFSRLIVIDRRGTGLSDRLSPGDLPPLEELADDVNVVLDAVGSARAAVLGTSDCGALCAMFAAAHPERTLALILYGTDAKGSVSSDYMLPGAWSPEEAADFMARLQAGWGTLEYARESLAEYDPSLRGDEETARWYASFQRLAASPGAAEAIERLYLAIDVRAILPTIGVPTLVVHRTGDPIEPVAAGRYIADNVPAARFVELDGIDHHPWAGDHDAIAGAVERFLADLRGEEAALDRILATVLFTDIVDSTAKAAAIGDGGWRAVRERHDQIVRAQLTRYRGREVKTMGDGFLATFDGPARGVRCAMSIVDSVRSQGIEVRAGLHTGELELGDDDVSGIAVAIGARVGALAGPSQVLVSSTVKDLVVGSGLSFEGAGEHELKGVPGVWSLYSVIPAVATAAAAREGPDSMAG